MYPHQLLMEEQNLQEKELSAEAKGYVKDFNNFLKGVKLKESKAVKAGKEFEVSSNDKEKMARLSKSICIQIYEDVNEKIEKEKKEAEEKRKEAEMLAEQQRLEDEKIKAETERLKAEKEGLGLDKEEAVKKEVEQDEEPSIGFFF
jgi:hypothetical protein